MIRSAARICLLLALASPPLLALAADRENLAAVIAWSGEGRVFQVAPQTMEFLGAMEGITYVETGEGEVDEAFVECAVKQFVHENSPTAKSTGNCMIIPGPEDAVFAEFEYDGEVGSCKGEFRLTLGTRILKVSAVPAN